MGDGTWKGRAEQTTWRPVFTAEGTAASIPSIAILIDGCLVVKYILLSDGKGLYLAIDCLMFIKRLRFIIRRSNISESVVIGGKVFSNTLNLGLLFRSDDLF